MMSSVPEKQPWLERFLDSFFQERNIQWLLGIGILILLGSSTMLVTQHWETTPPVWKAIVLFAGTCLTAGVGFFAGRRLGLRKTGNGLLMLAICLIPIDFLAVRWVHPEGLFSVAGLTNSLIKVPLWGGFAAISALMAQAIFRHFLKRDSLGFLVSYLVLAFCGALLPLLPTWLLPVAGLALWGVFAFGTVEVSRHVFCLIEDHRLPRFWGFSPALLLCLEFLLLFWTSLLPAIPQPWIGLGLVMMALPVLKIVDELRGILKRRGALASGLNISSGLAEAIHDAGDDLAGRRVEERRHSFELGVPLVLSLLAILSGVILSIVGFPESVAVVPTAALATVAMACVAERLRSRVLVWATLLLAIVCYQTCPVFVKGLVQTIVSQGAVLMQESRLPFAFYGLTYLPLLVGLTLLSCWREVKNRPHWRSPIVLLSSLAPIVLLVLAGTHPKAMFPVGIALTCLIGWQLTVLRNRLLLIGMIASLLLAAAGCMTFLQVVLDVQQSLWLALAIWLSVATLLLTAGRWWDNWTLQFHADRKIPFTAPITRWTGLAVLVGCSLCSLTVNALMAPAFWTQSNIMLALWCGVLLLVQAYQLKSVFWWCLALSFPLISLGIGLFHFTRLEGLVVGETLAVLLLWGMGWVRERKTRGLSLTPFAMAARIVVSAGLILIQLALLVVFSLLLFSFANSGVGQILNAPTWYIAGFLTLIMSFELAWRTASRGLTLLSWGTVLLWSGATGLAILNLGTILKTLPVIWGALTLSVVLLLRFVRPTPNRRNQHAFWSSLEGAVSATLILLSLFCIQEFHSSGIAAVLVFLSLLGLVVKRRGPIALNGVLALGNLVVLSRVIGWTVPDSATGQLTRLTFPELATAALPVALVSAVSILFWEGRLHRKQVIAPEMQAFLWLLCLGMLALDLFAQGPQSSAFSAMIIAAMAVCLSLQQLWRAVWLSHQNDAEAPSGVMTDATRFVWQAEAVLLGGGVLLILNQSLSLVSVPALFAPVGFAVLFVLLARLSAWSHQFKVLSEPFRLTGEALPFVTLIVAVSRHLTLPNPEWVGLNSFALLLPAAWYFIRGFEKNRGDLLMSALVFFNTLLFLIWSELRWTDPQFFMMPIGISLLLLVERLEAKVPVELCAPLRYLAALIILVSPTFNIVGGSWLHLSTLLVASLAMVLLSMGLQIKSLLYISTAFLCADVVAMVVIGSLDHPQRLWIVGIASGAIVIALAAYCERHREQLKQRLRLLTAQLETWR